MTEQNNPSNPGSQESCCSPKSSCCCCGKKFLTCLLVGLLLFGSGFVLGKNCPMKMCPVSQVQTQK